MEEGVMDAWAESGPVVVFDTVYTPARTRLVRMAEERSMLVVPGLSMFVEQARAQSALWTGVEAPAGVMTRIAEEVLASPRGV